MQSFKLQSNKDKQQSKESGNKRISGKQGIIVVVFIIVMGVMLSYLGGDFQPASEGLSVAEENVESSTTEQPQEQLSDVERIQQNVKRARDFEVTVWSGDNFADESTPPPYEVIVNTGPGKLTGCFDAKNALLDVMKGIYEDAKIKVKISRVLFGGWGQLRASMGAEDGLSIPNWNEVYPTNFWKTFLELKPYEDETGALSQRTWGVAINADCE